MITFRAGCTALLAFVAAACTNDSTSSGTAALDPSVDGANSSASTAGTEGGRFIAMRDDCDPRDANWNIVGGCSLRRGSVTFAEFGDDLDSPHAPTSVIGHPSWRNDPSYLAITPQGEVRVRNEGGRPHTFTEVAEFGGGKVPNPALNKGLAPAPECPGSTDIAPGQGTMLSGLAPGNHRFQCCIHPWMRAVIKVRAE